MSDIFFSCSRDAPHTCRMQVQPQKEKTTTRMKENNEGNNKNQFVRSIAEKAEAGDEEAAMFVEGFCLSIAKYIASLSADVSGKVDVIILTGGIAWNASLMEKISGRISFIAPVKVYPGGSEMDSLAENGYAVLSGKMPVKYYQGIQ